MRSSNDIKARLRALGLPPELEDESEKERYARLCAAEQENVGMARVASNRELEKDLKKGQEQNTFLQQDLKTNVEEFKIQLLEKIEKDNAQEIDLPFSESPFDA